MSLFYLELKDGNGQLNNIQIHKLKNKLGTRQLPTAELLLNGAHAVRVGTCVCSDEEADWVMTVISIIKGGTKPKMPAALIV